MNPLRANFAELYQRHLCRHSQLGLNVNHFVAVVGTYLSLFGLIYWLGSWWALAGISAIYLAILALNVPLRVFAMVVVTLAGLFAGFAALPEAPIWVYPLLIVVFYQMQQWGHKVYTVERDMNEFRNKYPKGPALFVLLSVYELPILLNYLAFDRNSEEAPSLAVAPTTQTLTPNG